MTRARGRHAASASATRRSSSGSTRARSARSGPAAAITGSPRPRSTACWRRRAALPNGAPPAGARRPACSSPQRPQPAARHRRGGAGRRACWRRCGCASATSGSRAVITRDAVDALKLKRGQPALAVIKSTEVMIAREAEEPARADLPMAAAFEYARLLHGCRPPHRVAPPPFARPRRPARQDCAREGLDHPHSDTRNDSSPAGHGGVLFCTDLEPEPGTEHRNSKHGLFETRRTDSRRRAGPPERRRADGRLHERGGLGRDAPHRLRDVLQPHAQQAVDQGRDLRQPAGRARRAHRLRRGHGAGQGRSGSATATSATPASAPASSSARKA